MSKKLVQALLFFVFGIAIEPVYASLCVSRLDKCKPTHPFESPKCDAFEDPKLIEICKARYNHHKHSTKACHDANEECLKSQPLSNNDPERCKNVYIVCTDCCGFNQNCVKNCREEKEQCLTSPTVSSPSYCWQQADVYVKK
jgi:hypothetical protein